MKKILIILIFTLGNFVYSQNFQDTKGELQVGNNGQASYNLPIALPPSLKNIAPVINVNYSSGSRGGIVGQGWNVSGISNICRMSTRQDIEGFRDGVDFDEHDRLALDGQRLLLKSGTYWENGSLYETEYKSNTKIEYFVQGNMSFFIITSPDGSRSWYGSTGNGTYQNATSLNAWYIIKYEDVYGNFVKYNYANATYNNTSQLYIDNIEFSGNNNFSIPAINKIVFNYRSTPIKRVERDFIKGQAIFSSKILDNISVYTSGTLFRKYKFNQTADDFGYERLASIQESNGTGELSNPVSFTYDTTQNSTTRTEKSYANNLNFNSIDLSGDFDGDGRLDFMADNRVYTKLFTGDSGNNPLGVPFNTTKRQKFTATTLFDDKLNQKQSIVFADESTDGISFKVYTKNNNSAENPDDFVQTDIKNIEFNNSIYHDTNLDTSTTYYDTGSNSYTNECHEPSKTDSNEYLEGDFNGDGISEVIIYRSKNERYYKNEVFYSNVNGGDGYNCSIITTADSQECFLLDLDPNKSNILGQDGYVKLDDSDLLIGDKKYVMDFNADGKSDLLIIKNDKSYKVITFKQINNAPWVVLEVLGKGTIIDYNKEKPILFGDYNGDGKSDFMIPTALDSATWAIYYSNPKTLLSSDVFDRELQEIVIYHPFEVGKKYTDRNSYFAVDVNKDGKTDLIKFFNSTYKPDGTINDQDTLWQVQAYTNKIGTIDALNKFPLTYDSNDYNPFIFVNGNIFRYFHSDSPDDPLPLVSNFRYQGSNTDFLVVRNHYEKIEFYKFNKNFDRDNRLTKVTEANGNIIQTIEYKEMDSDDSPDATNTQMGFYTSNNSVNYPNIEIIRNYATMLVSRLTATINGKQKYQTFKYNGYISNYNYGVIGFKKTARSSWHIGNEPKIWTIQYNDPNLRGANSKTFASTNEATIFDETPSDLLSVNTNLFDTYTNPYSKVYNVLLNSQESIDYLTNIRKLSTYNYDGDVYSNNYFGLQTKSVTQTFSNDVLQGIATNITDYYNQPLGVGNNYFIGKPKSTNSTNTIYPNTPNQDTRTTSSEYSYTGFDLTQIEKKGNNTNSIFENMTYDVFGNLLTKTISCPSAVPSVASRTIIDEYDSATKRFVVKKTDHQNFVTLMEYNLLGQVKKSTDYMGVVSDFEFDNWGKLIKTTISNATTNPLISTVSYIKLSDGGYLTTSTNLNDNTTNTTRYDVLGNVIKTTTKGFDANTTISKSIEYDVLGHKIKESEPYFTSPSKWTTYEFDYLNRPKKIIASTGRQQLLNYSELTTISDDDGKITSATLDALGNKVQTTDPGGTINFVYYANGQLKESNYDGHKIKISIDGWGNKIAMQDPNVSPLPYTYLYDDFGQMIKETNPKGYTSYSYDNYGKLTSKKILGVGADYVTTYTYNNFGQLLSEISKKANGTDIDSYVYTYNNFKKLSSVTESNPNFLHTRSLIYDANGRIKTENNATTELASGFSANTSISNNYNSYNGIMDKITDANNNVLWQINSANEKMQAISETLGNGITIQNTFDNYNYYTAQKHFKGNENIVDNTYGFNPTKGTLINRSNKALGTKEFFVYDDLDRLTQWNHVAETILNCPFNTGTDGFVVSGPITALTNNLGKLKVAQKGFESATKKQILLNATIGKQINIKADFEKISANTNVRVVINEINPITQEIIEDDLGTVETGNFDVNYTVSTFSDVYIKFYLEQIPTSGLAPFSDYLNTTPIPTAVYTIDNLIVNAINVNQQTYDERGRINENNLGTYQYDNAPEDGMYRKTAINLTPQGSTYFYNKTIQSISYNMFKSPIAINESNTGGTQFSYNSHLSRTRMNYGFQNNGMPPSYFEKGITNNPKPNYTKTKFYTDDGSTEIIKENGTIKIITYINGNAYTAPLYVEKIKSTTGAISENKYYLHRDYLGSIIAITNASGTPIERRHFDAWGNLAKLQKNGVIQATPPGISGLVGLLTLDRGYTSHEHLAEVGLVQMNGRLYDPVLRTFLMPDNFIQQPENTQNYNRYAYVLNNPLLYTDPSGEFIPLIAAIAIGAFVSGATYVATCMIEGNHFSFSGLAGQMAIGAASAAACYGVGAAASNLFTQNAVGFLQGAYQGAVIGGITGVSGVAVNAIFTGQNITLKAILGGAATGAFIGGAIGGIRGGLNAQEKGLNFWSGEGESIDYVKIPANTVSSEQYGSNAEMRADYNSNIGSIDNISLSQVENKLNTSVSLANNSNLPSGWSVDGNGLITNGTDTAGGITYTKYSGGFSNKIIGSKINIAPGLKGYNLNIRNMVFKHEFMHAWHKNSAFRSYNTYSERATSTYSYAYCKAYGENWLLNMYKPAIGYYPSQYSWRNFNKIIPLWIK